MIFFIKCFQKEKDFQIMFKSLNLFLLNSRSVWFLLCYQTLKIPMIYISIFNLLLKWCILKSMWDLMTENMMVFCTLCDENVLSLLRCSILAVWSGIEYPIHAVWFQIGCLILAVWSNIRCPIFAVWFGMGCLLLAVWSHIGKCMMRNGIDGTC